MMASVRRGTLSCGVALFCCALAQRASAEATRVLFLSPGKTPFSARIQAEIQTMGFEVVPADSLEANDDLPIGAAARVIESPPPQRIELWLKDERTGRLALDRVVEVEPGSADGTSAVRASEQLRAFFQPLSERAAAADLMPPVPRPSPLIEPQSPPSAEKRQDFPHIPAMHGRDEDRAFQELAGAVPLGPGSTGFDVLFRARYRMGSTIGVGAKLVLPVVSSTVHFLGNSADVSASLLGGELSARLLTTRVATLEAHLGLAALRLAASGNAQAPYTSHVEHRLAALPSLGSELAIDITRHVRFCVGAELGVSMPKLQLAFAGQAVATWARPLALFSAGVAVEWGKP